jgi:hypothetical protein
VIAGSKLRDHAAEILVQVDLRVDDVGQHPAAAFDQRDGSLVTAGLDSED